MEKPLIFEIVTDLLAKGVNVWFNWDDQQGYFGRISSIRRTFVANDSAWDIVFLNDWTRQMTAHRCWVDTLDDDLKLIKVENDWILDWEPS